MHPLSGPKIALLNGPDYREGYANSVQIRPNLYDFLLMFGIASQNSPDAVNIQNFQGVYLSPQQAKALSNLLQENIRHYESAFVEIHVEQRPGASGPLQ